MTHTLCTSWKREILAGIHLAADVYKIALYTASARLDSETTVYTTAHEVSGPGYTAGGLRLEGFATGSSTGSAWLDWTTDPSWPDATLTARGALIYNSSKGKRAVAVLDFGGDHSSNNGTFTIEFPNPAPNTALINL